MKGEAEVRARLEAFEQIYKQLNPISDFDLHYAYKKRIELLRWVLGGGGGG